MKKNIATIKTPKAFAEYYLSDTIDIPVLLKNIYDYAQKPDAHKQELLQHIPEADRDSLKVLLNNTTLLNMFMIDMKIKIGPINFISIKDNYDKNIMDRILICLADFKLLLDLETEVKKQRSDIERNRKQFLTYANSFVKSADQLLTNSILSKRERERIIAAARDLKPHLKQMPVNWIDEMVFSFIPDIDDFQGNTDQYNKRRETVTKKNIIRRQGRPYEIKYPMMLVIYRFLTAIPPKQVHPYKEWCKGLTADIVNSVFKLNLSAKDVDNALHKP